MFRSRNSDILFESVCLRAIYLNTEPVLFTELYAPLLESFGEVLELLEIGGVVGGGLERARLVRVRVEWCVRERVRVRLRVRRRVVRRARAPRARRVRREERAGAGRRPPRGW